MTTPNFKNSQLGITVSTDHPSFSVGSSGILFTDGSRQLTAFTGTVLTNETDPIFTGSVAYNITAIDTGNWHTAYNWGNHAIQGYITGVIEDTAPKLGGDLDVNSKNIIGSLLVRADKDTPTGSDVSLINVSGTYTLAAGQNNLGNDYLADHTQVNVVNNGALLYRAKAHQTDLNISSTGSVNAVYGYDTNIETPSAATLVGHRTTINSTGNVGNVYGIWLKTLPTGTSSTYGIYENNSHADNYFAGNVGVGTSTPAYNLDVAGSGRFTEPMDNHCGLVIASSGSVNGELHIGSCSDSAGVGSAMGLRHSSMDGVNDYMIMANTDGATFVSAKDTKTLTLSAGGNDADTKLELRDVSGPNAGFRFNVNKSNVDLQYNGDNENNVFYIDASADSVGIGTDTPAYKLDVAGSGRFDALNINDAFTFPTGDGSAGQALVTDGSGRIIFSGVAGGVTALGDLSNVTTNDPINQNDVLAYSSGGSTFVNTSLDISLIKRGSIPFGGYSDDQMGHYFYFDGSSEAVINTDGDDINFRVEGSGGTNLLFTDAGTDRVGIGNNSPTHKLDVTYADGHCVRFADSGGSGVHIGDCALGANVRFAGMKHSDYNMTTDYMIVSDGTDTYISAKDSGGSVYLRPGGNAGEGGIKISDVGAGGVSTVFNEAGSDRDIRMEGSSDVNLFRLDAGEDRIGIGTAAPVSKLDVNGTITTTSLVKSGGTSSQFLKADGSVDSTTYLSAHPNISAASSVNNSGGGFIQDITVDSNGHVTGMTSATAVISNTGLAGSAASLSAILNIVTISSGDYAGLSSKNANTLYFVL